MSINQPHRILMTADTVGGVWTYALELTRALQTYDVEVLLATMGPPLTPAQREDAQSIPNLNLFKSDYKLEWMPDCWSDVKRAGDWLLHLENRLRPDVVHLNGYAHATLPWNSPTLVVGHSCVFSWWQAVHHDTPPAEWQRYKDELKSGLRAADLVVFPGDAKPLRRVLVDRPRLGDVFVERVDRDHEQRDVDEQEGQSGSEPQQQTCRRGLGHYRALNAPSRRATTT